MRAAVPLLLSLFATSCSKATPLATGRADTLTGMIDQGLLALEQERETQIEKYHGTPRKLALVTASDSAFLRRATLDAIGRLPTAEEARKFLEDSSPDKRAKLIDRLLADPAWKQERFKDLVSLFRVQEEVLGSSQKRYIDWVRGAVENEMPFDALARSLLTASGNLETNPATGYLLRDHGWMNATVTEAAWTFLGVDLVCANCHDHPFADWTEMQVYQMAACFGSTKITIGPLLADNTSKAARKTPSPLFPGAKKMGKPRARSGSATIPPPGEANELWPASHQKQREIRERKLSDGAQLEITDVRGGGFHVPSSYKYRDGNPGDLVAPGLISFRREDTSKPIHQRIRTSPGDGASLRAAFAEWITTDDRFAETFGLRVWRSLFVEPHPNSGFEPSSEPSQPGDAQHSTLANMLANTGCGAGPTPARWQGTIPENDRALKQMAGMLGKIAREVQFDAREMQRILMKTQAYQRAAISVPMGEWMIFLPAPLLRRMSADQVWDSLVTLGGEAALNEGVAEEMRFTRDLPVTLPDGHSLRLLGRGAREWSDDDVPMLSHSLARWMANSQPVARAANGSGTKKTTIDELFLATLTRPPSASERAATEKHLAAEAADFPSIAWALLNTGEFLFVQ